MRRLLLVAALAATIFGMGTQSVQAENVTGTALRIANSVLDDVPKPGGWQVRHVCVTEYTLDKSFCVYFPWPI